MNNSISRQSVIDFIGSMEMCDEISAEAYKKLTNYLDELPPVEPERNNGKWINDRGLYRCSCCHRLWAEWWAAAKPIERMNKEMSFCPMCGADMRGEKNDSV